MRFEKRMCAEQTFDCVSHSLGDFSSLFLLDEQFEKEKKLRSGKTKAATHSSEFVCEHNAHTNDGVL